jgi:hypothetical protein
LAQTKPFDLRELFSYKFLEISCYGPEVHFFCKNSCIFYIGRLDASYDPINNEFFPKYSYKDIKNIPELTDYNYQNEIILDKMNPILAESIIISD